MAAEDPTTWGEVCKNVGFSDNLYRTCREKVPDFNGFGAPPSQETEHEPDFDAQLARSARPIPTPPSTDQLQAQGAEEHGFLGGFFDEVTLEKLFVYGGVAAIIWWFFLRNKPPQTEASTQTTEKAVTAPKAA